MPSGLYRSDGKCPDGASVVPWRCGKSLVWDVTCVNTLAASHQALAAREPRVVAVDGESKKHSKYAHLESTHHFVPVAVETLGALGPEASSLLKEIASRIFLARGEERAHGFLLQQVAVAVQRGNQYSGLCELFVYVFVCLFVFVFVTYIIICLFIYFLVEFYLLSLLTSFF